MAAPDELSERERRFVEAFMGPAHGNATEAARLAGYAKKNARHQASRLLTKANIRHAIEDRVREHPTVLERQTLQEFWSAIVEGRGSYVLLKMSVRLKASELLGRTHKMFTDKVEVEAGQSLGELLAKAEQLWREKQRGANGPRPADAR